MKLNDIVMIIDDKFYFPLISEPRFGCWGVITLTNFYGEKDSFQVKLTDWNGRHDCGCYYKAHHLEKLA